MKQFGYLTAAAVMKPSLHSVKSGPLNLCLVVASKLIGVWWLYDCEPVSYYATAVSDRNAFLFTYPLLFIGKLATGINLCRRMMIFLDSFKVGSLLLDLDNVTLSILSILYIIKLISLSFFSLSVMVSWEPRGPFLCNVCRLLLDGKC